MSIKQDLQAEMKDALRARDQRRLDVIRLVKAEIDRAVTAPGFSGEADDELYEAVIAADAKKMAKALAEYEGYGDRGTEAADKLRFEVEYLQRWLPEAPSEAGVAELVDAAIEALGADDAKQAGRVIGHIMKSQKGLDGAMVGKLVRDRLAAPE